MKLESAGRNWDATAVIKLISPFRTFDKRTERYGKHGRYFWTSSFSFV